MNDIMKITQSLEDSNILLKGVTKAIGKCKGFVRAGSGNKKGKGIVRACYGHSSSFASQNEMDF